MLPCFARWGSIRLAGLLALLWRRVASVSHNGPDSHAVLVGWSGPARGSLLFSLAFLGVFSAYYLLSLYYVEKEE